jgi:hypothetical protein
MNTSTAGRRLADFCEVCGRPLISRRVRRLGRCGAHPRQPVLPVPTEPPDEHHSERHR